MQAQSIFETLNRHKSKVADYKELQTYVEDISVYKDMLKEDEHDDIALAEFKDLLTKLVERIDQIELQALLSGKYDASSCYFSLNAGAGGTDAQDWNEMLLRMYLRWMEKKGFKTTIIDQADGDEAGIKSVTVHGVGEVAYGYLKNGV